MDEQEFDREYWDNHKKQMKIMRDKRRDELSMALRNLRSAGFEIKTITPHQFRINECLDIYPANKRYHDVIKNKRGDIRGVRFEDFVKNYFGIGKS
jgi:hypothetical protein